MRIDLADTVEVGDTIYNCFMQPLVVSSIDKQLADDGTITNIVFTVVNTGLQASQYDYEHVYFADLYGEHDSEKSWVNWAKNNMDFFETFDHIETMKEIYQTGFADGFEHKKHISYEEQMQK